MSFNAVCNCTVCLYLKNGDTPLYAAAKNGHLAVVNLLLSRGADIEQANDVCD